VRRRLLPLAHTFEPGLADRPEFRGVAEAAASLTSLPGQLGVPGISTTRGTR